MRRAGQHLEAVARDQAALCCAIKRQEHLALDDQGVGFEGVGVGFEDGASVLMSFHDFVIASCQHGVAKLVECDVKDGGVKGGGWLVHGGFRMAGDG